MEQHVWKRLFLYLISVKIYLNVVVLHFYIALHEIDVNMTHTVTECLLLYHRKHVTNQTDINRETKDKNVNGKRT